MKRFVRSGLIALVLAAAWAAPAAAQQKLGYVDSDYILQAMPDFATIQQQIDRFAQEKQTELQEKQQEVDAQFQEYQARELLYTNEERQQRREAIMAAEEEVEQLRMRYFGPEGEIFAEQERLMRPLQERILEAIEEVATTEGYDYIFDKAGDLVFLYAREQNDLSDRVLEELGIDVESSQRGG